MRRALKYLVHHFKARYYARKFDVWKECACMDRKPDGWFDGDWISYDNKLYYGHPLFIFFESAQNSWWQKKQPK